VNGDRSPLSQYCPFILNAEINNNNQEELLFSLKLKSQKERKEKEKKSTQLNNAHREKG